MKKLLYILTTVVLALTGCTEETITLTPPIPGEVPPGVTASLAISSKNTWYEETDKLNAAIGFKSLGGEVVVDVATNVNWDCSVDQKDWVTAEKDLKNAQLILSCKGNKVEKDLAATVKVTAGDKTATLTLKQNAYGTLEITASENNFAVPAVGELANTFTVTSSDEDWTFETEACPWMLVERIDNSVKVTLLQNENTEDRKTEFKLIAGAGGGKPVTETIRIIQDRAVSLKPASEVVSFAAISTTSQSLVVEANFEWSYELSSDCNWVSVVKTDTGLTVTSQNNQGENVRTGTLTLKAGDGKANITEKPITINQTGLDLSAFVIGLQVPCVNTSYKRLDSKLPFDLAINATIDWGDGTIDENVTKANPTHTYAGPGYYIVSVKGTVPSINTSKLGTPYDYAYQITEIYNWGKTGLTSMKQALSGANYLQRIPSDNTKAFANISDFNGAFYACYVLEEIPQGLFDYATQMTDGGTIFNNCKEIKAIPADLFKNCSKVTTFVSAFAGTKVEEVDANLFASCTELTLCGRIFGDAPLKSIPATLFANNRKITDIASAFSGCKGFTSVSPELFANCPEVTSFSSIFINSTLRSVPSGLFRNNNKCTNFSSAFNGLSIETVPADLFSGCNQAANFSSCFAGCAQLQDIPAALFTNSGAMAKVTNFASIFKGCEALIAVPAGLFDGFTAATSFADAFSGCSGLQSIPEGLFATNTGITNFSGVFQGCPFIKTIPDNFLSGLTKVTSFSNLFNGCEGLESIGSNIVNGCDALTNISSMFKGCPKLKTIAADAFAGAPKISSIGSLFENCTGLETVSSGIFAPLTAATGATNIFAGCTSLRSVPGDLFSANIKINTFKLAFSGCTSLEAAPDGLFANNPLVTDYITTFMGCEKLKTVGVILGNNTGKAKCTQMFKGCEGLETIAAGAFDGMKTTELFDSTFEGCTSLTALPDGLFYNCAAVTSAARCFYGCTSIETVPSRLFGPFTSTKVITFMSMFQDCTGIETIATDAFSGINGTLLNLGSLFKGCTSLKAVPDGLFKNATLSGAGAGSCFAGCTSLKTVGNEIFDATDKQNPTINFMFEGCIALESVGEKLILGPKIISMASSMFKDCTTLKSFPTAFFDEYIGLTSIVATFSGCTSLSGESPYTEKGGVKYHLYERTADNTAASGFKTITNMNGAFKGCTQLTDYEAMPVAVK